MEENTNLTRVLEIIISENCHYEWLEKLANHMLSMSGDNNLPIWTNTVAMINQEAATYGTEEHLIMEILCILFGDYGVSLRSGWISKDKLKECAEFIMSIVNKIKYELELLYGDEKKGSKNE